MKTFLFLLATLTLAFGVDVPAFKPGVYIFPPKVIRGSVGQDMGVALKMMDSELDATELLEAKTFLDGVKFDKYNEVMAAKVFQGIPTANFDRVVDVVADMYKLDSKIKETIKLGKFMESQVSVAQEFVFVKGGDSKLTYGRVITRNDFSKLDVAFSFYNLDFKFSALVDYKRMEEKSGWWLGRKTRVWYDATVHEVTIDEKKQQFITTYFKSKAIKYFAKEFKTMIESQRELQTIMVKAPAVAKFNHPDDRTSILPVQTKRGVGNEMGVALKMMQADLDQTEILEAKVFLNTVQFDKYHETMVAKVMQGIPEVHFDRVVDTIGNLYQLNDKIKETIKLGKFMEKQTSIAQEFIFHKGGENKLTYGRVITRNDWSSLDFAFAFYNLNFIFSPRVEIKVLQSKSGWWLGRKTRSWVEKTYHNVTIDEKKQQFLVTYFRSKAVKNFASEFKSLIQSQNQSQAFFVSKRENDIVQRKSSIREQMTNALKVSGVVQKNLDEALDLLRSIQFSHFEEKSLSHLMNGVPLRFFSNILTVIFRQYEVPEEIKEAIINTTATEGDSSTLSDFFWRSPDNKQLNLLRIGTVEENSKVDLGICSYKLKFDLIDDEGASNSTSAVDRFKALLPPRAQPLIFENDELVKHPENNMLALYFSVKAVEDFKQKFP